MQKLLIYSLLSTLLIVCGCQSTDQDSQDYYENNYKDLFGNGSFGDSEPAQKRSRSSGGYNTTEVQKFRGIKMPDLLAQMESDRVTDWQDVRNYVYPVAQRPKSWPPKSLSKMSGSQKAYYGQLMWPTHIRKLLRSKEWDGAKTRKRLSQYGRMYYLVFKFQNEPKSKYPSIEDPRWKEFAEAMLVYGNDGQLMLIHNMIVSLSSPDTRVISNAQSILYQIGAPALDPLCAALWTRHNQLTEFTDENGDMQIKSVSNPDFNTHIADTIFSIGPRAVSHCIYELENTLDKNGKARGTSYRFRQYFIELLGKFRDPRGLKAIEAELDRVIVEEPDLEMLRKGKFVTDERASDHAQFLFQQHIIAAIGNIREAEGLRPIIRLWATDEFHKPAALKAILKITNRMVRSIDGARRLAKELKVDLKGA